MEREINKSATNKTKVLKKKKNKNKEVVSENGSSDQGNGAKTHGRSKWTQLIFFELNVFNWCVVGVFKWWKILQMVLQN